MTDTLPDRLGIDEARRSLEGIIGVPFTEGNRIEVLRNGDRIWSTTPSELGLVLDPQTSARTAYEIGRKGFLFLVGYLNKFLIDVKDTSLTHQGAQ